MKKPDRIFMRTVFDVLLGNAVLAFAVAAFVLPSGLIAGGTTGISIVVRHVLGVDVSVTVAVVNAAMFALGVWMLGLRFALTTVLSTVCYPIFLALFRTLAPLQDGLTQDMLLAALYAGVLMGFGIGLVLRQGASTGGMDIPPLVLNKKLGTSVAAGLYGFDVAILLCQALFSTGEQILYGLCVVALTSLVVNMVIPAGKKRMQLLIVSEKYEAIRSALLHEADVGVTMLQIETGYEAHEQKAVLCVVEARKAHTVSDLAQKIDPHAFLIVSQINEVRGKGFTMAR